VAAPIATAADCTQERPAIELEAFRFSIAIGFSHSEAK